MIREAPAFFPTGICAPRTAVAVIMVISTSPIVVVMVMVMIVSATAMVVVMVMIVSATSFRHIGGEVWCHFTASVFHSGKLPGRNISAKHLTQVSSVFHAFILLIKHMIPASNGHGSLSVYAKDVER